MKFKVVYFTKFSDIDVNTEKGLIGSKIFDNIP